MSRFMRLLPQGSAAGLQPSSMTPAEAFTTDDTTELNGEEQATQHIWQIERLAP